MDRSHELDKSRKWHALTGVDKSSVLQEKFSRLVAQARAASFSDVFICPVVGEQQRERSYDEIRIACLEAGAVGFAHESLHGTLTARRSPRGVSGAIAKTWFYEWDTKGRLISVTAIPLKNDGKIDEAKSETDYAFRYDAEGKLDCASHWKSSVMEGRRFSKQIFEVDARGEAFKEAFVELTLAAYLGRVPEPHELELRMGISFPEDMTRFSLQQANRPVQKSARLAELKIIAPFLDGKLKELPISPGEQAEEKLLRFEIERQLKAVRQEYAIIKPDCLRERLEMEFLLNDYSVKEMSQLLDLVSDPAIDSRRQHQAIIGFFRKAYKAWRSLEDAELKAVFKKQVDASRLVYRVVTREFPDL